MYLTKQQNFMISDPVSKYHNQFTQKNEQQIIDKTSNGFRNEKRFSFEIETIIFLRTF